jgi:hypothetical protein
MAATVLALAPQAQAASTCPPNPPSGSTVVGNITVPGGSVCVLQEVKVTGNVKVNPGGELIIQGGQVNGNVTITDGWFYLGPFRTVPHIGGTVTMSPWRGFLDCGAVVDGDYSASNETVASPPPVAFPGCGAPIVEHIGGNLTFMNNASGVSFFLTAVSGNFTATGNHGGAFDQLSIDGSATCANTPPATFTNSTVGGTNKCPG